MTVYPCAWATSALCVIVVASLVSLSKRRLLRRAAFTLPFANACLGVLAGFAGWWWFATTDVMYADAALPLLANPIALHLFHSSAWAGVYPMLGESRWVHFLVLPTLIGTVGGCAVWFVIGWLYDRIVGPCCA